MRNKGLMVLGVVLVAATAFGYANGLFDNQDGLPGCETKLGLANAKAATNNSPVLRQNGITALGISDAKTITTTESRIECEGRVTLSSGMQGPIRYTFMKDQSMNAPFLVRAEIEPSQLAGF